MVQNTHQHLQAAVDNLRLGTAAFHLPANTETFGPPPGGGGWWAGGGVHKFHHMTSRGLLFQNGVILNISSKLAKFNPYINNILKTRIRLSPERQKIDSRPEGRRLCLRRRFHQSSCVCSVSASTAAA